MLSLKGKVSFLVKSGLIDGNTHYVWFKNNCPAYGDLYDDIRISRIEDDGYICGLAPKLGYADPHLKGKCSFWSFSASGELVEKIFSNYRGFRAAVRNGEVMKALDELRDTYESNIIDVTPVGRSHQEEDEHDREQLLQADSGRGEKT